MDHLCLIALGSNLASDATRPQDTINAAFAQLAKIGRGVQSRSSLYHSPAFPAGAGPDYVNAAAIVLWDQSGEDLLKRLHEIESDHGRERVQRWGQRTLDLDLLAIGDSVIPDSRTWRAWAGLPLDRQMREAPDQLILPHPRLHERAFVLKPLAEIAPDWRHPILGLTTRQMRDELPEAALAEVKPL